MLKGIRSKNFLKALGPGLIFAGTCIGVSHLVQSTRAGASYGFSLLGFLIAANIFKFPFFEFAPRYVAATGNNLLVGYKRVGGWAFYLFLILSLCTMFPIQAAVTLICTGLFVNLFHWPYPHVYLSILILAVCCVILILGKYPVLDRLMKILVVFLGISTVVAFVAAVVHGSSAQVPFENKFVWTDGASLAFLVALMGWMPTTMEIGVWHSFWSVERQKQTQYKPTLKEALFDFHIGYWGTMIMAILFLSLGALVMYGTGETFSNSAAGFTGQVITLYTKSLGSWSYWIIAIAAATTMFSTTICCLDAFPRVVREAAVIINPKYKEKQDTFYLVWIILISIVSVVIIGNFIDRIKSLIDFATILAFLATPVFAYMNLRTVTDAHVPVEARPSKRMIIFSWFCITLLTSFGLFFIYWRFILNN
jgi:Mn2+/Fe2+ NRAMP family transporter